MFYITKLYFISAEVHAVENYLQNVVSQLVAGGEKVPIQWRWSNMDIYKWIRFSEDGPKYGLIFNAALSLFSLLKFRN